jgi:gliding motility-associated-like protein
MRVPGIVLPLLFMLSFVLPLPAQTYILNGNATQNSCNCYTLTQTDNYQRGSVWNSNKINLTQPFDFWFNVYLGCKDGDGADGIVFILQTVPNSIGLPGGGMGFLGVNPSIGVALDTWQNFDSNDPSYDHISIQANGSIMHGADLAGPVSAMPGGGNIEDCQWHIFRIAWDPVGKWLRAYFDDSLRVQAQVDLRASIFVNNQDVYWGFSAATGGANNLHQFCTALNPGFKTQFVNNTTCIGNGPVEFTNTSVSFAPIADYYWDFGDGTGSTVANPPPHLYSRPGEYKVKLAITGFDGCKSDTFQKVIAIGDYPQAAFNIYDTCAGKVPRLAELSSLTTGTISQWNWTLDSNPVSTTRVPQLQNVAVGNHVLGLQVTSSYGCTSTVVQKQFEIKPVPVVKAEATGACIQVPVKFNALQLDNATHITSWNWNFGDGVSALSQSNTHTYKQTGNYNVQLTAIADNGCISKADTLPLIITKIVAFAGNDTMVIKGKPHQLHAAGGDTYNWTPALGMNNAAIADPIITLEDDIVYKLEAMNASGCKDVDFITITVFKRSDIYVPTAFSPNNDGLNEEFKPSYTGIKRVEAFSVYNRWGQLMFTSRNQGRGWDGTINGIKQGPGAYVWQLKAIDFVGKVYEMKGAFVLIR